MRHFLIAAFVFVAAVTGPASRASADLSRSSASSAGSANYCVGPNGEFNPYCSLMTAIGQCRRPNNPYENGLKALRGNNMQIDSFTNAPGTVDLEITVTSDVGRTLKRVVGKLSLHTEFVGVGPSAKLVCSLQVNPVH